MTAGTENQNISKNNSEAAKILHRCRGNRCKICSTLVILSVVIFALLQLRKPALQNTQVIHNAKTVLQNVSLEQRRLEAGRIRYKHTQRRLPQAIIIGARKAGTRALLTFLNLHPQILVAKNEVHFFDENYENDLEWYRKKMPYSFPGQITLEKSPAYFVSNDVPERIHTMNNTIKLLLVVRDPVERAVSDYLQIRINKEVKDKPYETFEELAINEDGEVDRTYNAIRRSVYSKHMEKWLKYFSLEQFHIISAEGFIENPLPYIMEVETFLGLDHRITKDNFYFNETRGFYCIRNETMEKCLNDSKGRVHPSVRQDVLHKLRAFFRPFNQKFYKMVGIDFGWP